MKQFNCFSCTVRAPTEKKRKTHPVVSCATTCAAHCAASSATSAALYFPKLAARSCVITLVDLVPFALLAKVSAAPSPSLPPVLLAEQLGWKKPHAKELPQAVSGSRSALRI